MSTELQPGLPAPAFELRDQTGEIHRLADYAGQWLVLYFYPRDDTPGCTREACAFRDDMEDITALDARVMGISLDNHERHRRFADKYHLPFPLLSDTDGAVSRAYGSYFQLPCIRFSKRHTFIIDPRGRIANIHRKVAPNDHSSQILAELKRLQRG